MDDERPRQKPKVNKQSKTADSAEIPTGQSLERERDNEIHQQRLFALSPQILIDRKILRNDFPLKISVSSIPPRQPLLRVLMGDQNAACTYFSFVYNPGTGAVRHRTTADMHVS